MKHDIPAFEYDDITGTMTPVVAPVIVAPPVVVAPVPVLSVSAIEKLSPWEVYAGPPAADAMPTGFSMLPSNLFGETWMNFHLAGPAYCGALWVKKFGAQPKLRRAIFSWKFYLDPNSVGKVQAIEAEFWQSQNRVKYMYGCQVNVQSGKLQIWQTNKWLDTGIALTIVPGVVHTFKTEIARLDTPAIQYLSFTMDDKVYKDFSPAASVQPSTPTDWGDDCGIQFQQDMNAFPGAFDCKVKDVSLVGFEN